MMIVNADDWGRSQAETEAALRCYQESRITSATAMVFMEDSARAADLGREAGIDIGLHLNLNQCFSGEAPAKLRECHDRVVRFLTSNKYALIFYHPLLRDQFRYVYNAQAEEFQRLYGRLPPHLDGHQHMHLCSNMLLDGVIPAGQKIRRSFSFGPGQKGAINRAYRHLVDLRLKRKYHVTDFFFALSQHLGKENLQPICQLAVKSNVEVMTHPIVPAERDFLLSDEYLDVISAVRMGNFAAL